MADVECAGWAESSNLELRPADPGDMLFLMELFASTREAELSVLDGAHRSEFVYMQFRARNQQYRDCYPTAEDKLIMLDDHRIGRILVDRRSEAITLVDIALLPEFRGRRIGTQLIRELMAGAAMAGLPLELHVYKFNPSVRLYQRLGFSVGGDDGMYLNMCYRQQNDC